MQKDFYSPINDYDEERDNSINQNSNLFQPQESIFFSDEQQNANKYSLSDYNNDNFMNYSPFPYSQQFSPFPSLDSNEQQETNKSTFNNPNNCLNKECPNNSQKKLDEISKKDEKKNNEAVEKNNADGKLSKTDKEILEKNLAEKIKENKLHNTENLLTNKKRRTPRIHLEDLNIDPKLAEKQSYQIIGDKVITSKNKMSEDDRNEVKAIRNRISAQKSRDRKKAEFINLLEEVRILKMKLAIKDHIIKKYKELACTSCKKIFEKIDEEFSDKIINFNDDNKEYLTLEENNTIFKKLSSNFGKLTSAMIGLVCLIGIIFCVFKSGYNFSTNISEISNNYDDEPTIRHLSINEQNLTNKTENKNLPMPVRTNLTEYEKYLNTMQMCHKKFVYDVSSEKNKPKQKNGFLVNKKHYKDNGSVCLNPKSIPHHNYILENVCDAIPVENDNTDLNKKLSCKIISMFIKDYYALKGETNEKDLSIQEQIEIEAKKSDDGFVYIQMIFPDNKAEEKQIDFKNDNKTFTNDNKSYFEIRCKILETNNYNSKTAPIYSEV